MVFIMMCLGFFDHDFMDTKPNTRERIKSTIKMKKRTFAMVVEALWILLKPNKPARIEIIKKMIAQTNMNLLPYPYMSLSTNI